MSDYWLEVGGILFYTLFVNTLVIKKKGINKLLKMQERIIYFFFIRYLKLLGIILYNVTKCICKNNEKKTVYQVLILEVHWDSPLFSWLFLLHAMFFQ